MYNKNLIVKKNKIQEGLYSNIIIPPKKPIICLTGKTFTKSAIKNKDEVIQIGPNLYLGPSGSIDDKINHSCHPTAFINVIGNKAILFSINEIKPNMEITFDYSLSCLDSELQFNCKCGSMNCRKNISTYKLLPQNIKDKYLNLNIVPIYIKHNIFKSEETIDFDKHVPVLKPDKTILAKVQQGELPIPDWED